MASLERPRVEYRTPEDLVRDVRKGIVRIPQFQRNFKWEAPDIVKLFDSLMQGYPIGNLLLWQRPAAAEHIHIGPLSIDAPAVDTALWVVDGQQRITSLVGALTSASSAMDPRFRIHLDLDSGQFHTAGIRQAPPATWVPVDILLDTATLLSWMRTNSDWLSQAQLDSADRAAKALREYQIPTYVVVADDEAVLHEIFTRINTTGKRLTKSEVFQALNSDVRGDDLSTLSGMGRTTQGLGFGALDDRIVLRCVLAYQGGDIFREDFSAEFGSQEDRNETFRDVVHAIREAVRFLQSEVEIPHVKLLPYSHAIPLLVRFVRLHGRPEGRAATLLRRWVWRGAVAGTRARGVSVPAVRSQMSALDRPDAVIAATEMLRQVQQFPDFRPELDRMHFSHAMAKLVVLGMLSADPRDPSTGNPLDLPHLLEAGSPLRPLFSSTADPLSATAAARVVAPAGSPRALRNAICAAPADLAASHLVDPESQDLLASFAEHEFLERRSRLLAEAIVEHTERMAEWNARDGRSLSNILRPSA